jgi:predicted unusual protein kinase regulating ubiquinone biosynthesis (AarF/ABC1/UbiB family)
MSKSIRKKFEEEINFDEEARQISKFLDNLK